MLHTPMKLIIEREGKMACPECRTPSPKRGIGSSFHQPGIKLQDAGNQQRNTSKCHYQ